MIKNTTLNYYVEDRLRKKIEDWRRRFVDAPGVYVRSFELTKRLRWLWFLNLLMRASCLFSELLHCRNCFMMALFWFIYKVFRDIKCNSRSTIFLHVEDPCATKECHFHAECSLDKNGEARCSCIRGCLPIYDPVCASDGQSYPNECGFKMRACAINCSLTILHRGHCSESIHRLTFVLSIFIF